ncbi:hypothetical protein PF010_g7725 [Phytophthora fragariae]|uniref:Uncharacterized protein n=1 Tax=Phytophthora fragariae TaxID=53985 RepID=A0A6G0LHG6_9STRA|nr:hypothetical protein PF010_g7725 [Phytophthora fragariae]
MSEGNFKYVTMKRLVELSGLISTYLEKVNGLKYDPTTEVLVSNGAQQSVYQVLSSRPEGDQSSRRRTGSTKGKSSSSCTRKLFRCTRRSRLVKSAEFKKTMTAHPDAKAAILCIPSHPAGTLNNPKHLERITAVLRKPQFWSSRSRSTSSCCARMRACPSASDNAGILAAPKYYIDQCMLLQVQLTSCPNTTVGHVAAVEALTYELE